MNEAWTAEMVTVLAIGLVLVSAASLAAGILFALRADAGIKKRDDLIQTLADRLMAGDWANFIAGQTGDLFNIDRRVGLKQSINVTPTPTMPLRRNRVKPEPDDFGADDMTVELGPLVSSPEDEEAMMNETGR